jgi:hypothetical protein
MKRTATRNYKSLIQTLSHSMMFSAAVLFCIAGRIIHDIWDIQRQLAYLAGFGLAFFCGGLGSILNTFADNMRATR